MSFIGGRQSDEVCYHVSVHPMRKLPAIEREVLRLRLAASARAPFRYRV